MGDSGGNFGAELRRLRLAQQPRLSQRQLAKDIGGYAREYISQIEHGDRLPAADVAVKLDVRLGTGRQLAALRRRVWLERQAQRDPAPPEEEAIPTNRRELFGATAAVTLAGEVSRQLAHDNPDPLTLEELEADAVAVAVTYWSTPHETLIPHVAAQWQQVEKTLAGRTSLAVRPRLTLLAGQYAYYLGRLGYHAGNETMARRFAVLASQHAGDHGDPLLVGSVAGLRSCMAFQAGQFAKAAELAAQAQPGAHPYVRARLAAYEASGHAAAGRADDARHALAVMRSNIVDSAPLPGAGLFDEGEAELYAALALAETGAAAEAEPVARSALANTPTDHYEAQGLALVALGRSLADHDPGAAAHAGKQALDTVAAWPAASVVTRGRRLHATLATTAPDVREVAELGQALAGSAA